VRIEEHSPLNFLRSQDGAALLAHLAQAGHEKCARPAFIQSLRREHSIEIVTLALRLAEARRKASVKYPRGDELFFTPELLEQASAHPPAMHRARRLAPLGRVLDLGCGGGGDLTRLAQAGSMALGMERDALALAMAKANLETLNLRGELHFGAFPKDDPPAHDALFVDPARREGGRRPGGSGSAGRRQNIAEFSPSPAALRPLLKKAAGWCIKWGPALDLSHEALAGSEGPLADLSRGDYELELVSWKGELREAAIWGGGIPRVAAAATVLEGELDSFQVNRFEGDPGLPAPAVQNPGEYIHEPDSSLIRSGLLADFAHRENLFLLAEQIAYLSSNSNPDSPFVRTYKRLESFPFSLTRVQEALDRRQIGTLALKKRGFPLAPEELRKRLRLAGGGSAVLIIHRSPKGHLAHLCEVSSRCFLS